MRVHINIRELFSRSLRPSYVEREEKPYLAGLARGRKKKGKKGRDLRDGDFFLYGVLIFFSFLFSSQFIRLCFRACIGRREQTSACVFARVRACERVRGSSCVCLSSMWQTSPRSVRHRTPSRPNGALVGFFYPSFVQFFVCPFSRHLSSLSSCILLFLSICSLSLSRRLLPRPRRVDNAGEEKRPGLSILHEEQKGPVQNHHHGRRGHGPRHHHSRRRRRSLGALLVHLRRRVRFACPRSVAYSLDVRRNRV